MWNERLRELREEHGLTQIELAKIVGLNHKTIYRYETGISEPTLSVLVALSKFFKVNISYLCGISNLKNSNNSEIINQLSAIKKQLDIISNSIKHN